MPLSNYSLDTFVAPKMSLLTECGMPELEPLASALPSVVLNRIFVAPLPEKPAQLIVNIIRKVEIAFQEYRLAREALVAHTAKSIKGIASYFLALGYVEQCLAATHQSICMLIPKDQRSNFPSDSPEDKIRRLYNTSKHVDERITEGKLLEGSTIAIWLTNAEIESSDCVLQMKELHELLEECRKLVAQLADYPNAKKEAE
jgi:hypothetical protein